MIIRPYSNREEFFELFTRNDEFGIPKLNAHPHDLHEWFEDEVNEYAEQYANQRLIEELDLLRQKLTHISFTAHCIDEINDRIKELKQE